MKDLLYKEVNEGDIIYDVDSWTTIGIVYGQTPIGRPRIIEPEPACEWNEEIDDYEYTGTIELRKSYVKNQFLKMTIEEVEEFLTNRNEEDGFEFGNGGVTEFIQALRDLLNQD